MVRISYCIACYRKIMYNSSLSFSISAAYYNTTHIFTNTLAIIYVFIKQLLADLIFSWHNAGSGPRRQTYICINHTHLLCSTIPTTISTTTTAADAGNYKNVGDNPSTHHLYIQIHTHIEKRVRLEEM